MSNLYDEAIADARALKEMAERNARNKIIESISPQIRRMVERQILAEQDDDVPMPDDVVPNLDLEPLPDDMGMTAAPASGMTPSLASPSSPDPDEEVTHTVTTKTASGTEVKINVRVDKHGEASATAEADEADDDDVEISLNKESLRKLSGAILGERKEKVTIDQIGNQFNDLKRVSKVLPLSERASFRAAYSIFLNNLHDFRDQTLSEGGKLDSKHKFNKIIKEMKNMSTSARFRRLLEEMEGKSRRSLRREAKIVLEPADLEGLDDTVKEKLRSLNFGVEFDEDDEMPVDVAAPEAPAPAETAPPASPAASEGMYDDEDEDDLDEYSDLDEDMEEEMEGDMYEDEDSDMEEDMYEEMENDMEEVEETTFRVDESMLRRELRRLREAKGSKGKNAKGIKDPKAKNFGGGDVLGLPEELNKLSESEMEEEIEEADEVAGKALEVAKKATEAAKEERKARVEEARSNRALKAKLAEADHAVKSLREQLEEVNLFNAKLLYVNKLMQNRDLTARQQRAVVESLDSAKSVREAKLLYTSLTESLKTKAGTMTEGRVLGSSSRSTRSASPVASLNESVEVDRWAILAGIKSDK